VFSKKILLTLGFVLEIGKFLKLKYSLIRKTFQKNLMYFAA